MKKTGILNADIAAVVARLGHLDTITVADAGLPIPAAPSASTWWSSPTSRTSWI